MAARSQAILGVGLQFEIDNRLALFVTLECLQLKMVTMPHDTIPEGLGQQSDASELHAYSANIPLMRRCTRRNGISRSYVFCTGHEVIGVPCDHRLRLRNNRCTQK
eukprot:TRINITY_DN5715_c0_g3_i1.p1 TRINITY_DN5715_c0_g3~~TRINITY_DN5715_c0_g3_i1.p1  ORF type:complete len:106 (-),score=7.89 TRINITY_DN5715_c0_g3_i1:20-337(-)